MRQEIRGVVPFHQAVLALVARPSHGISNFACFSPMIEQLKTGAGMEDKKSVFISFAKQDMRQRNSLKDHPLLNVPLFEFVDFPVKDPASNDWKDRVQVRIRRSSGVIILISKNSIDSTGQKWEISCAKTEKKEILGVWAYNNDRTHVPGIVPIVWEWGSIRSFIDSL